MASPILQDIKYGRARQAFFDTKALPQALLDSRAGLDRLARSGWCGVDSQGMAQDTVFPGRPEARAQSLQQLLPRRILFKRLLSGADLAGPVEGKEVG